MPFFVEGIRGLIDNTLTYQSLHTASPPTKENEVKAPSYTRARIFWEVTNRLLTPENDVQYDIPTGEDWGSIRSSAVWSGRLTDEGSLLMAYSSFGDAVETSPDTTLVIPKAQLALQIGEGDILTPEGAARLLGNDLGGGTNHIALHTADPNPTNEISETDYARQAYEMLLYGDPAVAMRNSALSWGTATSTWTALPTHFGVWSEATGGVLLMKGEFGSFNLVPVAGDDDQFRAR